MIVKWEKKYEKAMEMLGTKNAEFKNLKAH